MHYILVDGKPVKESDLIEWSIWHEAERYKYQKRTVIAGTVVSTVFLGIDHSFVVRSEVPILWETMVFGGRYHEYQERYCTQEEAYAGHEISCALILGKRKVHCLKI